jgi:cbb3-type cytochrome oxidase subunit 3
MIVGRHKKAQGYLKISLIIIVLLLIIIAVTFFAFRNVINAIIGGG